MTIPTEKDRKWARNIIGLYPSVTTVTRIDDHTAEVHIGGEVIFSRPPSCLKTGETATVRLIADGGDQDVDGAV